METRMIKSVSDSLVFEGLGPMPILGEVSLFAEPFADGGMLGWFTNSVVVASCIALLILWAARKATKNAERVPTGFQNFFEFLIEFLYSQVENIVGKKLAPKCFPLLATIFVYVALSNWFGLLPGIGTVGFSSEPTTALTLPNTLENKDIHVTPLLRPPTADLNLTLGMALVFMMVWSYLTIREVGVWGFLVHTFGPKGDLSVWMRRLIFPVFLFVGVIEMISIALRPVSLSLRLFGNIFAGENLLHTMSTIADAYNLPAFVTFIASVLAPLPIFFLELLVGGLQAVVFSLLCAVYIQLSTTHDEEAGH